MQTEHDQTCVAAPSDHQQRSAEVNSLQDVFHVGASEVVGERVHLAQSGLDGEAAQDVFRVQLVEVKGQFSDPIPLWLTEAREDLKRIVNTNLDVMPGSYCLT